ncbi:hypothetical protein N9895_02035 [Gammaproteobacteria bacterium]|nr:hypothetical protein [Gammaproteobacteria bacterium]
MQVELGSLGIIEGDKKRALEDYIHPSYFRQRKTFDEYYLMVSNLDINIDLNDMQILSENFIVRVLSECIILSEK